MSGTMFVCCSKACYCCTRSNKYNSHSIEVARGQKGPFSFRSGRLAGAPHVDERQGQLITITDQLHICSTSTCIPRHPVRLERILQASTAAAYSTRTDNGQQTGCHPVFISSAPQRQRQRRPPEPGVSTRPFCSQAPNPSEGPTHQEQT